MITGFILVVELPGYDDQRRAVPALVAVSVACRPYGPPWLVVTFSRGHHSFTPALKSAYPLCTPIRSDLKKY